MDANGWGVLHEWVEGDDVQSYLVGPFPTESLAEVALNSRTCDCATKVIAVMFPSGIIMHVTRPGTESGQASGSPLLPDRIH